MRFDLAQLSLAGLELSLGRPGHAEDCVAVEHGEGISGRLLTGSEGVQLEEVLGTTLTLNKLLLTFGSVKISTRGTTQLRHLQTALRIHQGETSGSIHAKEAHATSLRVEVGALVLSAELEVQSLTLELVGSAGQIRAERATFRALSVQAGELSIQCPELHTDNLTIGWGDPAFRVDCDLGRASEIKLAVSRQAERVDQLELTARASDVSMHHVHVRRSTVELERLVFARIEAALEFARRAQPSSPPRTSQAPSEPTRSLPFWDISLLDKLAGNLVADIEVDLSVPILGSRRATHELRAPVQEGSVDYTVLEKGLSLLEDSLLDFAVRDGALVLELGLPLLSVRGRGKPIVIWDLSPEDYRLAERRQRVRLAVLPTLRFASARQSEPPPEFGSQGSQSRFALRSLSITHVHTHLSVAPRPLPMPAMLSELIFHSLNIQGTVHHDAEANSRPGLLRLDADALTCSLQELPLGSSLLAMTLHLSRLEDAALRFEGPRPRQLTCVLSGLALESVRLSPRVSQG